MPALHGRFTDRLLAGQVPADPLAARLPVDDRPKPEYVRHGWGIGLGAGATRARCGEGAS